MEARAWHSDDPVGSDDLVRRCDVRILKGLLDAVLHVLELVRELMRPGELQEWRRVHPDEEVKLMRGPIPKDSSCYPYHEQLDHEQLVHEDDFLR